MLLLLLLQEDDYEKAFLLDERDFRADNEIMIYGISCTFPEQM